MGETLEGRKWQIEELVEERKLSRKLRLIDVMFNSERKKFTTCYVNIYATFFLSTPFLNETTAR